jgi:hypothetical protein
MEANDMQIVLILYSIIVMKIFDTFDRGLVSHLHTIFASCLVSLLLEEILYLYFNYCVSTFKIELIID